MSPIPNQRVADKCEHRIEGCCPLGVEGGESQRCSDLDRGLDQREGDQYR